jgi:MFS family permease
MFKFFSRAQQDPNDNEGSQRDNAGSDLENQISFKDPSNFSPAVPRNIVHQLPQTNELFEMVHYHHVGSTCHTDTHISATQRETTPSIYISSHNNQVHFQTPPNPLLTSRQNMCAFSSFMVPENTPVSSINSDTDTINPSGSSTHSSLRKSTEEDPNVKELELKSKHLFKFWSKSRASPTKNVARKPTVFENPDVGVEEKELIVHIASDTDPRGQREVHVPKAALQAYLKREEFAVYDFTGMEYADPKEWSKRKKLAHTVLYGITTLVSQFNSAIMSPAVSQIMNEFNVSFKIAVLCTCLYILGIALGPLLFAPISERYGRKLSTLLPFVIGALFTFMAACSTRIWFVILFRGLAGVCSAAPMVISGGMLSDIWSTKERGNYLVIYSNFVTLGPCVAPIVASVLLRHMSWRGLLFITSGFYLVVATVNVLSLSESYVPVILAREASARRMRTGNFLHHAKLDETSMTLKEFLKRHVRRPLKMMTVPLIALVALYASFVFGLFYLVTTSVPTTFQDYRDFSQIHSGLPMLAVYTGATVLGVPINLLAGLRYARKLAQNDNKPMPEQRLFAVLFLGLVLPLGIALFGYTVANSQFHWIVPCVGLALIGAGFFVVFQGCLNFLVDALPKYSASAMAVSTCMRSMLAGFFPLFSREIFYTFGIEQGASALTTIAVLCVPIPFCFFYFSNTINKQYQQYNFDL